VILRQLYVAAMFVIVSFSYEDSIEYDYLFAANGWEFLNNFYTPIIRSFLH